MWRIFVNSNISHSQVLRYARRGIVLQKLPVATVNKLPYRNFYLLPNGCHFNNSSQHLNVDKCKVFNSSEGLSNYLLKKYTKYTNYQYKKKCVNSIVNMFNCTPEEAKLLMKQYPKMFLWDVENSSQKSGLLLSEGIQVDFLRSNIWLLELTLADLKSRLQSITLWGIDSHLKQEFLPLLKLNYEDFFLMSSKFIMEKVNVPYGNRIIYLSKSLEHPVIEVTERLLNRSTSALLRRDFQTIKASLKAYKEFDFQNEDILNDLRCLRNTKDHVYERLSVAVQKGVKPLKTWFVRCTKEIFNRTIELHETEKTAFLPYRSREEFIAAKFDVGLETVEELKITSPVIFSLRAKKLVEMLELLTSAGFTLGQILSNSNILNFSVTLLKERLYELKSLGVQTPKRYLCKSQDHYEYLVERIISSKEEVKC